MQESDPKACYLQKSLSCKRRASETVTKMRDNSVVCDAENSKAGRGGYAITAGVTSVVFREMSTEESSEHIMILPVHAVIMYQGKGNHVQVNQQSIQRVSMSR